MGAAPHVIPVFTNKVQQVVPFLTGYKLLSVHKPDCVAVGYPPIVDEKPNDMATVYTAMQISHLFLYILIRFILQIFNIDDM